jgi:hypothetical protein
MGNEETLRCGTCGKTHREIPIIEKPLQFGYRSKTFCLIQRMEDHRDQENICLECLGKEIGYLACLG